MNICGQCGDTFDPSTSDADRPESFCSDTCQLIFTT